MLKNILKKHLLSLIVIGFITAMIATSLLDNSKNNLAMAYNEDGEYSSNYYDGGYASDGSYASDGEYSSSYYDYDSTNSTSY